MTFARAMIALCLAVQLVAGVAHAQAGSRYNFDYDIRHADAVGLVRAFDDGSNTVLSFLNLEQSRPTIATAAGDILAYRVVDNYAVLPGLQREVFIYSRGHVAQVAFGRRPQTISETALAYDYAVHGATHTPAPAAAVAPAVPTTPGPASPAEPRNAAPAAVSASPTGSAAGAAPSPTPAPEPAAERLADIDLSPTPTDAAVASAPEATPGQTWVAPAGSSLRVVLENWADTAGWDLEWHALVNNDPIDYPIPVRLQYEGTFLEAARALTRQFRSHRTPPRADAYLSQQLIHIEASAP